MKVVYYVCGFLLLFIMVALDALTNRPDVLSAVFDYERALTLQLWLAFAEDTAKNFSEAFFILGFYAILLKVRSMGEEQATLA